MRHLNIPLERDGFMRRLIGELAAVLHSVVGEQEASGFVSLVGRSMGRHLNAQYCEALGRTPLGREDVGEVMVDLKRRIQGDFAVESSSDAAIVLTNRACPFAEHVVGRPALCMMTSNVFGTVAATHLGYARVEIQEAIARGDLGCRVVVHLQLPTGGEPVHGEEYFGDVDP